MFRIICLLILLAPPAFAQCAGQNMIETMPDAMRAQMETSVAAQPYPSGNRWRAVRGDQQVVLIGTYHLYDPRLNREMLAAQPLLDAAQTLLVEAGPFEEDKLAAHMVQNPEASMIVDGPTLPESLTADEWAALSDAAQARGVPPFMAAKFQPWYLSMVLAIAPCQIAQATAPGLDKMLITAALAQSKTVVALEPWDTILNLFATMGREQQIEMIRMTLPMERHAEDQATTLADTYFMGEARMMWEFLRLQSHSLPGYDAERADAEFAEMEAVLLSERNRAWIPVIEQAAEHGPVLAAFGALHLAGHDGVLALLAQRGFEISPLP